MDATLQRFECYFARGPRRIVILPHEMIADTKGNLIRSLAAELRNTTGGWFLEKERMREHVENLPRTHQYKGS